MGAGQLVTGTAGNNGGSGPPFGPVNPFAGSSLAWGLTTLFNGTSTTCTVTIAGAVAGGLVIAAPPADWPAGMILSAFISAANTVTLTATNSSGSTQNIPVAMSDVYQVAVQV